MPADVDIVVVGAGFAGSLVAAALRSMGFDVVLVDRTSHPRFAIGESSTPAASLLLEHFIREYALDELLPLCKYGTWRDQLPQIRRGLKRGFSYFNHMKGERFQCNPDHSNELLVAASRSDEAGDTQWFRSDVDQFLCDVAQIRGAKFLPNTEISNLAFSDTEVVLELTSARQSERLSSQLVINATNGAIPLQEERIQASDFRTATGAIFGHFRGLPKWEKAIGWQPEHPFHCDDAAVHHLLDEGWMWWIRFDEGTTSVGLVLESQSNPLSNDSSPEDIWNKKLADYPTLRDSLANAIGESGLRMTRRIQRGFRSSRERMQGLEKRAVGTFGRLLELPNALGFVDPLHSTGIAHSISGVIRVCQIVAAVMDESRKKRVASQLSYLTQVTQELTWIDDLVSGCYQHIHDFPRLSAFAMCYFAAATTFERRFLDGSRSTSFLCADDHRLRQSVETLRTLQTSSTDEFVQACKAGLAPFNHVGLFEPEINNMYAYTALPG